MKSTLRPIMKKHGMSIKLMAGKRDLYSGMLKVLLGLKKK